MFFVFFSTLIYSQNISGKIFEILENGEISPLIGANIIWEGTSIGTVSDNNGFYSISAPDSYPAVLNVSFIGYESHTKMINAWRKNYDVSLRASVKINQGDVRRNIETTSRSIRDSINLQTISAGELEKAACCNLSECFETNAAVDVVFSDALSGAKKVKMLSLDGVYTYITQENMPMVRGVAASYGLTYVPGSWIESIQIIKGAGSVTNGFESLTGQINVELYQPESAPRMLFNAHFNHEGKIEANLLFTKKKGDWTSNLFTHMTYLSKEIDHHGSLHDHSTHSDLHGSDNFLDVPKITNVNILNRWKYTGSDIFSTQMSAKLLVEDRRAGTVTGFSDPFEIDIHNDLIELSAKLGFPQTHIPGKSIGSQYSFKTHNQTININQSDHTNYSVSQKSFYINIVRQTYLFNEDNVLKYGINSFLDYYDHNFSRIVLTFLPNQSTMLFNSQDTYFLPGIYSEYSHNIGDNINVISGIRADYIRSSYNPDFSPNDLYFLPRMNLKYNPSDETVVRLSFARSMRVPHSIIENSSLLFSNRRIIYQGFQPLIEVAWNYGVNFSYCFYALDREGSINLDAYRTVFDQQTVVNIENPRELIFHPLGEDPDSYSNVLETSFSYELWYNLDLKMAYKINKTSQSYSISNGIETKSIALTPKDRGLINLAYSNYADTWKFDVTCNYIGQSRIPNYYDNHNALVAESWSDPFYLFNTQITKSWDEFDVYIGSENISNVTQDNPILHAHNPSSLNFDASLVYAPVMGRSFYLGLRYKID